MLVNKQRHSSSAASSFVNLSATVHLFRLLNLKLPQNNGECFDNKGFKPYSCISMNDKFNYLLNCLSEAGFEDKKNYFKSLAGIQSFMSGQEPVRKSGRQYLFRCSVIFMFQSHGQWLCQNLKREINNLSFKLQILMTKNFCCIHLYVLKLKTSEKQNKMSIPFIKIIPF